MRIGKYLSIIVSSCLVTFFCAFLSEDTWAQDSETVSSVSPTSHERSSSTPVKGITAMRARSLVGGVLGLISLVIGWRARNRALKGIGNKGRKGAVVALSLGAVALLLSLFHLSLSAGAVFGSGSGKAGAIVALVLSLIGITLSIWTLRHKQE